MQLGHLNQIIPQEKDFKVELARYWQPENRFVIVGSVGAITRLIAPIIRGKDLDPAILVLDPGGEHVIPLLGGHSSGAERCALELAAELGGTAVITSSCFYERRLPVDCFGEAWGWRRSGTAESWRNLMKNQARAQPMRVMQNSGDRRWLNATIFPLIDMVEAGSIDFFIGPNHYEGCSWHPPTLWIGVGCERGTSITVLRRGIARSLDEAGLAIEAVAGLATADRKANEPALLALCEENRWLLRTYAAENLATISAPTPSETVFKEMGTASVAEAAALLTVGNKGSLLQTKRVYHASKSEKGAVTIAVAESTIAIAPQRGELHLIGSGPGDPALLSNDCKGALSRCSCWVGYKLYLDLIEPLRQPEQIRFDGELTKERDRCSEALELACQGARVALISSGDSGIYGMAGLALDLWLQRTKRERPKFQVHPGISALQLAAAKVGAPLMHDFCAISLSDWLTPWHVIEKRIKSAATGDFVIALYNPRSKDRDWQLAKTQDVLLKYRRHSTPVALARQLGRENESIKLTTLEALIPEQVDMLTIILIGNSSSYSKDGMMLTPRVYTGTQ
ncbi:precorrin-3B C(17)-methyltransferase [Synechococcus sp. M16CYN]|uniref:precorrin-3B C(17)-methyltransferase n=1 Tax=Synechococcus sp. M16CYN TaxID=3103139 RepID=UPI00324FF3DB